MTPPAWRWSFILSRTALVALIASISMSRILRSLSDDNDRAFAEAVAWITAITVVAIVTVGLLMQSRATATVRKVRDTLAAQYPDQAFLVQKTSRMQSDLKSLKPDLFGSGWSRWTTAMVVTVDDRAFTIWDHDHGQAVEVLTVPWASVMSVKMDRAGVGVRWMDAVVARVHSGPIKIDLVLPLVAVKRGRLIPAEPAQAQAMAALFTRQAQTPKDQVA